MIHSLPPYILYLIALAVSFIISVYAVRKIIFITSQRKIFDIPDNTRKIHGTEIPSLGGIGIFVGYIVVAAFFMFPDQSRWNYILISSVILFFTGIYDDLMNMQPLKKLLAQLIASAITIYFTVMPALFNAAPTTDTYIYYFTISALTFGCTFFINAFNFIDGIDGLACVLAVLYTLILGILFALGGELSTAAIIFSLSGATMGLLYYNRAPARIYMGDTGSMLIGFNVFIFSVLWPLTTKEVPNIPFLILVAILFLPAYDAIRVFILRISRGLSPLKADRSHLHYYLLDAGFSHSRAVFIITSINVVIIGLAFVLSQLNFFIVLLIYTITATLALLIIYRLRQKNLYRGSGSK